MTKLFASDWRRPYLFAHLLVGLVLFPVVHAQTPTISFTYSISGRIAFPATPTTELNYTITASPQLGTTPYQNIQVLGPGGVSSFTERTSGGTRSTSSSGLSFTSLEDMIAARSGTWTLITDYQLGTETAYTFTADFSAVTGTPFVFSFPSDSGAVTNPLGLQWSGPVNNGPFNLLAIGFNTGGGAGFSAHYPQASGATFQQITFGPGYEQYGLSLSHFTSDVSFASITTPVTSGGIFFSGWLYRENLSQGASASGLTLVPEPGVYASLFGAVAFSLVVVREFAGKKNGLG